MLRTAQKDRFSFALALCSALFTRTLLGDLLHSGFVAEVKERQSERERNGECRHPDAKELQHDLSTAVVATEVAVAIRLPRRVTQPELIREKKATDANERQRKSEK